MDQLTNDKLQAIYREAIRRGIATRGEHVPPERVQDLVARRGDDTRRLADLDHVMSCEVCRTGYDLLRSIEQAQEPAVSRTRWVPIAAAAALVLAAGLFSARQKAPPVADSMRDGAALPTAVAPVGEVAAPDARTLIWRAVPTAIRYDVTLLGDAGMVVHSAATAETTYTLPINLQLVSATDYQWVVSAELPSGLSTVGQAGAFRVR